MKMNLKKIEEYQNNLSESRGNELNRNFWRMMLAEQFPKVIEQKDGEATVIEFMGQRYIKQ
jgi:ribosomal protein S6